MIKGNSIVPQVAAEIIRAIVEVEYGPADIRSTGERD
jgi:hypothetical protein